MKVKAYPKWVIVVFALSMLGWLVMVILDFVMQQANPLLSYTHIALAAVYAVCTVVYAVQYALSKRAKDRQLAAQREAETQAAIRQALAAQQSAAPEIPNDEQQEGPQI